MKRNKKYNQVGTWKQFCLNLPVKILCCIFIVITVMIVILSAIPSLFIYLLTGNYSKHAKKEKHQTSADYLYE